MVFTTLIYSFICFCLFLIFLSPLIIDCFVINVLSHDLFRFIITFNFVVVDFFIYFHVDFIDGKINKRLQPKASSVRSMDVLCALLNLSKENDYELSCSDIKHYFL